MKTLIFVALTALSSPSFAHTDVRGPIGKVGDIETTQREVDRDGDKVGDEVPTGGTVIDDKVGD